MICKDLLKVNNIKISMRRFFEFNFNRISKKYSICLFEETKKEQIGYVKFQIKYCW